MRGPWGKPSRSRIQSPVTKSGIRPHSSRSQIGAQNLDDLFGAIPQHRGNRAEKQDVLDRMGAQGTCPEGLPSGSAVQVLKFCRLSRIEAGQSHQYGDIAPAQSQVPGEKGSQIRAPHTLSGTRPV